MSIFNIKEFISDLVETGIDEETATIQAKEEIKKRKIAIYRNIKYDNDIAHSFREKSQKYNR